MLRRHRARLARKVEALRGDLAEAERAPEHRRSGETLLAYLRQVPPRAHEVVLPDPADPGRNLRISLDPAIRPQANAARYFKRAGKGERGLRQIPPRLSAAEAAVHALEVLLARAGALEEGPSDTALPDDPSLDADLEATLAKAPPSLRGAVATARPPRGGDTAPAGAGPRGRAPAARLEPRRLRSKEGWEVLIGRTNDGNDYLTHHLARPEDYWFHVHGAAGSHVVLRRGKGRNEPSKATIAEVAGWAAYHSRARTAGKVPVLVTRKKYVRKPRKAPPGLALCTHEKTVIVKPMEPPPSPLGEHAPGP